MFAVGDRVEFTGGGNPEGWGRKVGVQGTVHKVKGDHPFIDVDDENFSNDPNGHWPPNYWRAIDQTHTFIPEDWS